MEEGGRIGAKEEEVGERRERCRNKNGGKKREKRGQVG